MDFYNISVRIKESINTPKKKIMDKDIAKALELDPQYYAVIKRRNKIPYKSISQFCQTEELNMNWILLGKPPKYIKS